MPIENAGFDEFQRGLEQQLLLERVTDLHRGALGSGFFGQILGGEGGAVNAVAPGGGADDKHGVAFARGDARAPFCGGRECPTAMALMSGFSS